MCAAPPDTSWSPTAHGPKPSTSRSRSRPGSTAEVGPVPFLLLLNKADLQESWDISRDPVDSLEHAGWVVLRTSAKTGEGVEEAFQGLAQRMVS